MAWDHTDDQILAYLAGELSPAERIAFEQTLKSDLELQQALKRHQAFEEQLRGYSEFKEREGQIRELGEAYSNEPKTVLDQRVYLLLAVAAVVVLIFLFAPWDSGETYCPQDLYASAFVPRSAPEHAGQGQNAEQQLRLAHGRFNQGNIPEAISLYRQALLDGSLSISQQTEIYFFFGQCLMQQDDFEDAQKQFAQIKSGPYYPLSQWYTALAYLALGQPDDAKHILEQIQKQPGHDRQTEATELLEKWGRLSAC